MDIFTLFLWIAAIILVVAGLAGLVVPVLPGTGLILAGLITAAWAEGFAYAGFMTISVLILLFLASIACDLAAGALGARRFGADRHAVAGAMIGSIIGLFFGLPGVIIGPFIGAVAGQLMAQKDIASAGRAGIGVWIGLLLGTAAKITIGFAMIGIFILAHVL